MKQWLSLDFENYAINCTKRFILITFVFVLFCRPIWIIKIYYIANCHNFKNHKFNVLESGVLGFWDPKPQNPTNLQMEN